jgi:hypothetical protein
MTDKAATYVYCVLQGRTKPQLSRAPRGLEGMGKPRLLALAEGLWLVVADAPLDRYGSEPIERRLADVDWVSRCALAHDAIVDHMSRLGAVIPVKLFTLFAGDARALSHFARTRKRIDRLLRHVAGREEWGVQVTLDERLALKGRLEIRRTPDVPRSGTSFLLLKKNEKDAVKALYADATQEAQRIFETLSRYADDARQRTPQQGGGSIRALLDAAFLVESRRGSEFKRAVGALVRELESRGYRIRLTGPWPPYTFVAASS